TLGTYYPKPGTFMLISGILCTYIHLNCPEHGHFLAARENSGINCLYFSQMDGYRLHNAIFCTYFFRCSCLSSLVLTGLSAQHKKAPPTDRRAPVLMLRI
ncbi:hypothetical protein, partial [Paenibacillus sp. FSL M7-0831]|uniref:hypothetical protein n=1 Tax=Paenibacillus sp. FSL M7-0831 TaxID=2975314 RepID=UPI0030F626E5